MNIELDTLKKSEQVILLLSNLYEQYGYRKYCMNKLEEYSLYLENMNFLSSKEIIVFSDLDGRIMALKPDITLSIAKNAKETPRGLEKLYYTENVFRSSRQARKYRELRQMGLECIGEVNLYTIIETLLLAAESMNVIAPSYVLDISHLGFVSGLVDSLAIDAGVKEKLLSCLKEKNPHDLARIAAAADIPADSIEKLCRLVTLSGDFRETLLGAREIAVNDAMKSALSELEQIEKALGENRLRLDFSIVSDMQYYNGIMFQGYVESVPGVVLSGGQYDNLLTRMGKKEQKAIGFAIYFDELEQHYSRGAAGQEMDALVLYDVKTDPLLVYRTVEALAAEGKTVLAQTVPPETTRYKSVVDLREKEDAHA